MKRKVIQIADSTQLVSLPRKWALQHGIKKGDELDVKEEGSKIVVSVDSLKDEEKKLELTINDVSKFLRRLLFSPYIQGYTEVRVNYNDSRIFDLVSNEVELLMGYEIVNQGPGYCLIKRIATAMDDDFDNILNRILISTSSMMTSLVDSLKKNDFENLRNLVSFELTNNKLSYFCLRVLNNKGYKQPELTNSIYYIILEVEQIVDDLRDLCLYVSDNKIKVSNSTIDLFEKSLFYFEYVYKLFKNFDNNKLIDFNMGIKEMLKGVTKNLTKNKKDVVVLSYLHKIVGNISHISKEIHY